MKKKKYLKWWIAAVSAVFIVGAGIFVYTQYKAAQTSGDVATKDGTSASASDITWNGKTYSYNEHLSNFLFLGIDTKEKAETKTGQADAGQADALYLLSWNRLEGDITVIRAKIISVYLMHTVTADMKAVSWRKMQFPNCFTDCR